MMYDGYIFFAREGEKGTEISICFESLVMLGRGKSLLMLLGTTPQRFLMAPHLPLDNFNDCSILQL